LHIIINFFFSEIGINDEIFLDYGPCGFSCGGLVTETKPDLVVVCGWIWGGEGEVKIRFDSVRFVFF
jgi:hypothetical protein